MEGVSSWKNLSRETRESKSQVIIKKNPLKPVKAEEVIRKCLFCVFVAGYSFFL